MSKNTDPEKEIKNYLLKLQLDLIASNCVKSKSDIPQLYAICSKCDQPTPQEVTLNKKGDILCIGYPCVNSDCKEVKDEK